MCYQQQQQQRQLHKSYKETIIFHSEIILATSVTTGGFELSPCMLTETIILSNCCRRIFSSAFIDAERFHEPKYSKDSQCSRYFLWIEQQQTKHTHAHKLFHVPIDKWCSGFCFSNVTISDGAVHQLIMWYIHLISFFLFLLWLFFSLARYQCFLYIFMKYDFSFFFSLTSNCLILSTNFLLWASVRFLYNEKKWFGRFLINIYVTCCRNTLEMYETSFKQKKKKSSRAKRKNKYFELDDLLSLYVFVNIALCTLCVHFQCFVWCWRRIFFISLELHIK